MEGLAALLQSLTDLIAPIIKFFIWAFPIKIYWLHDGERGIIRTLGKVRRKHAERGAGIIICTAFEDMIVVQAKGRYIDFPEQVITTKDGGLVIINGAVEFEILSVQKAILELEKEKIDDFISGFVMNFIRENAEQFTLKQNISRTGLTQTLIQKMGKELDFKGIKIVDIMITDLRPHNVTMICNTAAQMAANYLRQLNRPVLTTGVQTGTNENKIN